jgi:hypothetical protein
VTFSFVEKTRGTPNYVLHARTSYFSVVNIYRVFLQFEGSARSSGSGSGTAPNKSPPELRVNSRPPLRMKGQPDLTASHLMGAERPLEPHRCPTSDHPIS